MKRFFIRLQAAWCVLTCADYVVITRKRKADGADTYRDMSEYHAVLYMRALAQLIIGGAETLDEARKILNQK